MFILAGTRARRGGSALASRLGISAHVASIARAREGRRAGGTTRAASVTWVTEVPFWAEAERAIGAFLEPETIQTIYTHGHPDPEKISPDNWNMDKAFLARPNARQAQLDFFYDYRTNVELYPKWQQFLKERQPKTIIFWGQDDIFFTKEGGEAYLKDLPKAEIHRLQSGHFALEDSLDTIADKMTTFYLGMK
jgi:pimeloyl-ACP methyl ester carboxylesterase